MNISILIGAHGTLSEKLINTVEMILGHQKNLDFINCYPEDSISNLIKKYNSVISKLKIKIGLIFLVDIWGGSPFNAASQIVKSKDNYEIITGVNVPMLVEILMNRNDVSSIRDLVKIAIYAGKKNIKSFKENTIFNSNKDSLSYKSHEEDNSFMDIRLVRIDDRLVHGQLMTSWVKYIHVKRIIIINNEIYLDNIRKEIIKNVSPPNISVHIVNIDKLLRVYKNPKYKDEKVIFLFTNPKDIVDVIQKGVKIKSVNIGGMSFKSGKIQIEQTISLNNEDVRNFLKLYNMGVELEIRKVFHDSSKNLIDLINRNKSKFDMS